MIRVATAVAIIAALLVVLRLPWEAFMVAIAIVGVFAWREYVALAGALGPMPLAAPGALFTLALIGGFASERPGTPLLILLAVAVLAAAATLRASWHDPRQLYGTLGATLTGLVWVALLLGAQLGIRRFEQGALWLLLLYATVAIGDSAAYYGGSRFGRRKLAPAISPNKTVEGSLFGLAGSAAAGALVATWIPGLEILPAALTGVALGAFGQAGDLVESALKRAAGVKDSSTLLPGHGGILDRIDAHLPAGGVLYVAMRAGWLP